MVQNLSPMVTVFFAYLFLKEKITRKQLVMLCLGFGAVCLVILGGDQESDNMFTANLFELFMLFMNPIAVATGQVVMRKMRKTSEWTVSCWVSVVQAICLTPFCVMAERNYLSLLVEYGWFTMILMTLMAMLQIATQTTKFTSLKLATASSLQPYNFIQPLQ
jgi:drug/metabolite transporter (DMT)-like permease